MKKIIICNIPMKESDKVKESVYVSDDNSLPVSDRAVKYPINSFLEKTLKSDDEVKAILLVKKDEYSYYQENAAAFVKELMAANDKAGAKIECKIIETEFSEKQTVHEELLAKIVDEIEEDSHILADITFGPKDLPIVVFAAMSFAERFLRCDIDNVIYGQANYKDGQVVNTRICDMVPLYYLNSVTNTIRVTDPKSARELLKSLLSL